MESQNLITKLLAFIGKRTIVSGVVQGILIGGGLAFVTAQIFMNTYGLAKQIQLTPLSQN